MYPSEKPNVDSGNHFHFFQILRQDKVDPTTNLFKGFHITIQYDYGFNDMNKQKAREVCLEWFRQMNILIGTTYSNFIDIGLNAITKNWACFIKIHLQYPKWSGIVLLHGKRVFAMEMEDEELVIGKIEKNMN